MKSSFYTPLRVCSALVLCFLTVPLLMAVYHFGGAEVGHGVVLGATLNFIDLVKANSNDVVGGIIDEIVTDAPELAVFDSEDLEQPGQLSYETLHRTSLPGVSFANAGEGFTASKSGLNMKRHECFRFGGRIECARHIADNWRRGGAPGYQAFEALGVLKAAMILLGRQIWYGVSYDGKGFPGVKAFTPKGGSYTYDATGTTATTASSVYFVKYGEQNCRLMAGRARNASGLMELPDFRIGDMDDPNDATKRMEAFISELSSYVGLQIAQDFSVGRICNLTEDSGKGLTDAKLTAALALFPANFKPDAIFMSRRSRSQLQNSRTVTLFGQGTTRPNQENVAPLPTEFEGIPITTTDNILNTDAIE